MPENTKKKGYFWCPGKEQQTRILLLLALLAASTLIFREYLFGQQMLVFNDIGSDTYQLYTMQFASVIRQLREGRFALWDFTNGFGVNQMNLNLFDPSQMLIFAMGYVLGPARVLIYLVLVQILRILAAGYVFYHFLSCFSLSRQAKFAAAFAYGLNGYLLVWGQHYQFGTATIYLPLMLFFAEKYLQGKKFGRLFPVSVFLCGIYSAYFSYMALAAVGLYLLLRSFMLEELTAWGRVKKFLLGCVQILLGLGMALGIFLPTAACILGVSGRVGGESQGLVQSVWKMLQKFRYDLYFESIFLRFWSSAFQYTGKLADRSYEYLYNYYEDPVLFSGILTIFLNLQLLVFVKRKSCSLRKKIGVYAAAVLVVFSVALPLAGIVLNGFSYYSGRFTFLLTPFLLLGMAAAWEELREQERANVLLLLLAAAWALAASVIGYQQSVFADYRRNALLTGILGILIPLCLMGHRWARWEKTQRVLLSLLLALLMVNVVSEADTNYEDRQTLRRQDTDREQYAAELQQAEEEQRSSDAETSEAAALHMPQMYFHDLFSSPINQLLSDLKSRDSDLYRVEKDFILGTTTMSMDSMALGYRGVTSYNSVQNQGIVDFVDTVVPEVHYPDKNHFIFENTMKDPQLASFLGIRYVLSQSPEQEENGYELVEQIETIKLYKNPLPTDFAHFYSETISEESFRSLVNPESRNQLLTNVLALEDGENRSSLEEIPEKSEAEKNTRVLMEEPRDDAHLTGTITAPTDGYVLFMVPCEQGWELTVDGQPAEILQGDLAFIACRVAEGSHSFALTFRAPGMALGMKLGAFFWILYLLLYFPGVVPLYLRKVRMK